MVKVYPLAMAVFILSLNLNAETSDHSEHVHQQGAHQHGLAELTLALEGDKIDVGLESPAANIVGFEHVASTPEQRGLVDKARAMLESPSKLFSFLGTHCELEALEVDVSAVLDHEDEEHELEESGTEKNDHDHSDHDKSTRETHSEVLANYQFHCEQGSRLTAITLNFFEYFPGIETLHAVWVTDSNQGSAKLAAESKTVYLSEMP